MADAILGWDNATGAGDLRLDGVDLAADDGLGTAVLVSLFTDRRVRPDELPEGDSGRRGWWGDVLGEDEIGSRLWLLSREKRTADVLVRAEAYAREALEWMIEDEVAQGIEVSAGWSDNAELSLRVAVTLPDRDSREFEFSDALRAG